LKQKSDAIIFFFSKLYQSFWWNSSVRFLEVFFIFMINLLFFP